MDLTVSMMDRVRTAFSNMVSSERYSRFTLQPGRPGGRAEVKLSNGSSSLDETAAGGEEEEEGPDGSSSPSYQPRPPTERRQTRCFMVLATAILFVVGFLLGYATPKQQGEPLSCATEPTSEPPALTSEPPALTSDLRTLDWDDITGLLRDRLRPQAFEETLRILDMPSRLAGSAEDMGVANLVFDWFKEQEMEPWTDRHYVQLPTQDSRRPNRVLIGSQVLQPKGYLAYSATGTVEGKVVYGNYGRPEDMKVLQENSVELKGCVMLLRAGLLPFSQKVFNAAEMEASAVLIYPDPQDYNYQSTTELYGHVHLGSGDPYTPGFPSFNHTQFPPTRSSGLPSIPAQTITAQMAQTLLMQMGGPQPLPSSGFRGDMAGVPYGLGGVANATLEVNNVPVNQEVHNVFGVVKGFVDPDRYVILGAQRDAWGGSGFARAAVGSALLMELAKTVRAMVEEDGFRPRRSLVFASWSAGEYGSVGATEWLEGYMSSIDKKAFTYISLDGAVMGLGGFKATASPLLYSLLESSMKQVSSPLLKGSSVHGVAGGQKWESDSLTSMTLDDPAYPFLAFSGIPSVSFHFTNPNQTERYRYYGTVLDTRDHLDYLTGHQTPGLAALAARLAGHVALRLAHDRTLPLDVRRYGRTLTQTVQTVYRHVAKMKEASLSPDWLSSARGAFQRAADDLMTSVTNSDLSDPETCRLLNDRIMTVEHSLLSPYVSVRDAPYRHLLFGRGDHTLEAVAAATDPAALRTQLALATSTLQGAAHAMGEGLWEGHDV